MHILAVFGLITALALLFVLLPALGLQLLLRLVAMSTTDGLPEPARRRPRAASTAERPPTPVGQLRLIS